MACTTVDLCRISGLSYRQVCHWTALGILQAIGDSAPETGYARRYATTEAVLATLGRRLTRLGVPLPTIRIAARTIREAPTIRRGWLLCTADGTRLVTHPQDLEAALGDAATVVDLGRVWAEVLAALELARCIGVVS